MMFDILSFFTEDTTTYPVKNIVMYVFDETRTDEFILGSLLSCPHAYISDEDLSEMVEKNEVNVHRKNQRGSSY